jgi:two-component system, NarL family, nitrate/nitrite response regulator NarL
LCCFEIVFLSVEWRSVSNTTPTVIIANSTLLREGMASLLQSTAYKVVAAISRPAELIDYDLTKGRRGLAIVGIDCQKGSLDQTAEGIRLIRSVMLDSKIVLVAEAHEPVDLQSVLALAADGYILNLGSRDMLVRSLELIFMDQQIFVLGSPITTIPNEPGDVQPPERTVRSQFWRSYGVGKENAQLSHRECEVLICLAHGESNKEIARVCHISEATVKVHLKAILRKINARNRTQAAIWAIQHGLCDSTLNGNAESAERHPETTTDAPSLSPTEPQAGDRLSRPINDHAQS